MKLKILLATLFLLIFGFISVFLSSYTYNTDFPAFYRAAKIIIDPGVSNEMVYQTKELDNRYNIPEKFVLFRFSIPISYIIAPLAFLPYEMAKTLLIFVEIVSYAAAVLIVLKFGGVFGRFLFYPFVLSLLWMPLIHDLRFVQVNSILLFFITLAVFMAEKRRIISAGILIGLAALFKVFPIAIAMLLGLKNWRIFASCILTFSIALILPGSKEWFASFAYTPFLTEFYSVIYMWLKEYNIFLYATYVAIVGGITALVANRHKDVGYTFLTSLAIPAVFLTMPVIEYFHLVILIFPYLFLLTQKPHSTCNCLAIFSFVIIYIRGFFFPGYIITSYLIFIGLLLLWLNMILVMIKCEKKTKKLK